jgi:2,5-dihydroxypyridine 5,6-dioxygenase
MFVSDYELTRILLAVEPSVVFVRVLPIEADRLPVIASQALIEQASSMRVVSMTESDFYAQLGQYPTVAENGYVDTNGRWDHWPRDFLFSWPNERTAEGVLSLMSRYNTSI